MSVDELVSDHNLIQFTASFSKPQKPTRTIVKRNWREIDIPTFTADVQKLGVSGQSDDPAFLLDHIESVLCSSLDTYAPDSSKTVTICPQQVWYTPALKSLKSAKGTAETTCRTDKKNILENRIKYKAAKVTYNVALDEAKCSHYNSKIKDAGQDSHEVNRVVKTSV